MALLASRAKTANQVEKILNDKDHPAFMKALEFAADRGFGKVPQGVVGPNGGPLEVQVRFVREGRRVTAS